MEDCSYDALWDIGMGEECEGVFSLNKRKYDYDEKFEKFMIKNGSPV